jgi:hypothetical protein
VAGRPSQGMPCSCGGKNGTEVIDSRPMIDGRRRRHLCRSCGERFTTYEITASEYERLQSAVLDISLVKSAISSLQAIEKAMS